MRKILITVISIVILILLSLATILATTGYETNRFNNFIIDQIEKNTASNETYLAAANGGAVELYHNNSKKFETTSAGGTLTGNLTVSGEIVANSDVTLKENILPITNPLDIINSIKGVQYNFKDKEKKNINYGFLAQEMEKVLPSIVHETDSQENLLGIAYDNIIAILLEGVKSLSNEVEELKNKIEK